MRNDAKKMDRKQEMDWFIQRLSRNLSFECVLQWQFRAFLALPSFQMSGNQHVNGFSPVWTISWPSKSSVLVKVLSLAEHVNPFSRILSSSNSKPFSKPWVTYRACNFFCQLGTKLFFFHQCELFMSFKLVFHCKSLVTYWAWKWKSKFCFILILMCFRFAL